MFNCLDLKCTERLLSGQVVVQPSEFAIKENDNQKVEIVIGMTEQEFTQRIEKYSVGAVLAFSYHDIVDSPKPYR